MIRIFLAYATEDFEIVSQLYKRLSNRGFEPWMDRENILGGQNWRFEIPKAIKKSHAFVPCFSSKSVSKQGYVQREFRMAMNEAAERPPGAIYIIPIRLDQCDIPDLRQEEYGLSILDWQWIDTFETDGFGRLVKAIENGFPDLANKSNLVYCRRFQDAITHIAGKHGFDMHSRSSGYL